MKRIMITLCLWAGIFAEIAAQNISQKLDELMNAYAQNREFNGTVLVARKGKILLEKGYGYQNIEKLLSNSAVTLYPIASITKTFTATLILKLAEQRLLSIDDKLSKYYPDFPSGDSISIEHLLTHTSGIYNYTNELEFMLNEAGKPASEQKIVAIFKNKPLDFPPGKGWNYSNSGYCLLGYIIEKVTKMPYYSAVRKYIFEPYKMNNSGFDFVGQAIEKKAMGYYSDAGKDYNKLAPLEDSSVVYAAGAIYSSAKDLYKWHQALQQHRLISKTLADKAYTPFKHNYGYGWIIDSLYHKKIVSHSGGLPGYRSNFVRIIEDDICIVLLNNTEIPGLSMISNGLLAILYNQPYKIPTAKKAITLDKSTLERYVGSYEVAQQKLIIQFKIENNQLVAYPFHGPRSVLMPFAESAFFDIEQEQVEISFEKDSTGNFNKLTLNFNGNIRTGYRIQ
ncbi:serine hydrolase [Emticicia sp. 17c]|uniref:serine hydrolase n=1 Tax=Emticicia sp. 17c TaxID=3127704 RepID=UPI00301E572F